MTKQIKKVQSLSGLAVFKNFNWDTSVKDVEGNIVEFKKINILYGRNYSGKTTLSRVLRSVETGNISDKYDKPEYILLLDDGSTITQKDMATNSLSIRVFNEDFVRENLRFIVDENALIQSFAILGEENNELEAEIERLENILKKDDDSSGLTFQLKQANEVNLETKKKNKSLIDSLDSKLRDKANNSDTGIKHNKIYGNANYDINKLKKDIETVKQAGYINIDQENVMQLQMLVKEETKIEIPQIQNFNLVYDALQNSAKKIIEKKIQISEPLQELLNDAALQSWVEQGRSIHESTRKICGFCGSELPKNLWDKLDKHFNEESKELKINLSGVISEIDIEKVRILELFKINTDNFYTDFHKDLKKLKESFDTYSSMYISALENIESQLRNKEKDIFKSNIFQEWVAPSREGEEGCLTNSKDKETPETICRELERICEQYNELRQKSNKFSNELDDKKSDAIASLRLSDVNAFISAIQYDEEVEKISESEEEVTKSIESWQKLQDQVEEIKVDLKKLRSQLKDESKGAEKVNEYLNDFFGNKHLSLQAIKNTDDGNPSIDYHFEVIREGKKAYHLSEGECSLITFCYFIAKLEDIETVNCRPIIWIDDPISSMDSDHIFFVYSLIHSNIVKSKKMEQLFISTHNLDFLKYLKRLSGVHSSVKIKQSKKECQFFLIQRREKESSIELMPSYLEEYVTEFNHLFGQIYKCANQEIGDMNYTAFYNFGNAARKFLEIFLYYKYPNLQDYTEKIKKFFSDEALTATLADRVNNEYSHLAGLLERGALPVDVAEIQKVARCILDRIKQNDLSQYKALLESIGIIEQSVESSQELIASEQNLAASER